MKRCARAVRQGGTRAFATENRCHCCRPHDEIDAKRTVSGNELCSMTQGGPVILTERSGQVDLHL